MAHISDIKLIRTDTTLDLSQKAEKGMFFPSLSFIFYTHISFTYLLQPADVGLKSFHQLSLPS